MGEPLPHEPVSFKWQTWEAPVGGYCNEGWAAAQWCAYLRHHWLPTDRCEFTLANGQRIIVRPKVKP